MLANIGQLDRTIRIALGAVLVAIALAAPSQDWAWLGVVPLASGLARYCPVYALLGVSTCRR